MKNTKFKEIYENNKDIFVNRTKIAEKIINNIKKYGDLSVPDSYGIGYDAGSLTLNRFGAANYLRYIAAQEGENKTLGYLSEVYCNKNEITVKQGAVPVVMEKWDINSAKGRFVNYYCLSDLENTDINTRWVNFHDSDIDFDYAGDLFEAVGLDRDLIYDGPEPSVENIKKEIFKYAKEQRCNDLSAALTVHLFCRRCHLSQPKDLFTEDMISTMEKSPDKLFRSMKTATKICNYIDYANKRHLNVIKNARQTTLEDVLIDDEKKLFDGLEVEFFWSEGNLKSPDGKYYVGLDDKKWAIENGYISKEDVSKENFHIFKGEEAYKFLAALVHKDKELFNKRFIEHTGYNKTKLNIIYRDYEHGTFRTDLGDLEWGNKESVIECLEKRLNMHRNNILNCDDTAKEQLIFLDDKQKIGVQELREEAAKEKKHLEEMLKRLYLDEKKYYEIHPEIKEYNAYKADTYKFVVEKRFLEHLKKLPTNGMREYDLYLYPNIKDMQDLEFNNDFYYSSSLINSNMGLSDIINYTPNTPLSEGIDKLSVDDFKSRYNGKENNYVIIESYYSPQHIMKSFVNTRNELYTKGFEIACLYTEKEYETYKKMENLEYSKMCVPLNPYVNGDKKIEIERFEGVKALRKAATDFYNENRIDSRDYLLNNPVYKSYLSFDGRDQQIVDMSEKSYSHEKFSFYDTFCENEKNKKDLEEIVKFTGKYYDNHYDAHYYEAHLKDAIESPENYQKYQDFHNKENKLLSVNEKLEKWQENFPDDLVSKSKLSYDDVRTLAKYYHGKGNIILGHKHYELKDANRIVLKEMIKDGLSEAKIKNVFMGLNNIIARSNIASDKGIAEILKEPEIKKLLNEQKTIKRQGRTKTAASIVPVA